MEQFDGKCLAALLLGLLPGFEPRYALPVLATCLPLRVALLLAATEAVLLALLLALLVPFLWDIFLRLASRLRVLERLAMRVEEKRRHAGRLVERYGLLGLALFVAVPLPVTGIYTGAAVALLLGLDQKRAGVALAAGGAASTLLVALGLRGTGLA